MKKNLLYFLAVVLLWSATACNKDFIDATSKGVINIDNYFSNQTECETYVDGLYKSMMTWEDWWQQWQRIANEMATDDAWMGNLLQDASGNFPSAHYSITPSNYGQLLNFYQYKYRVIGNSNIAIQRLPDAPITSDAKKVLIAQAKFIRAYTYWELVQNFGDVPLVLEPKGTSQLNMSRTPKAQIYTAVIQDLKDAETDLPAKWDGANLGRITKGACTAMLARTYLFMKDYQNAYDYSNKVITSGVYSLEPNFVNIWSAYNHNGVESIFEIQTNSNQNFAVGNRFTTIENGRGEDVSLGAAKMDGWGWCVPTSNLEQAYKSEGDSVRMKSTIIRNGFPVYGDETDMPKYLYDPGTNKSCRTWRKVYLPAALRKTITNVDMHSPIDLIVIRLGEMYLTRSEAAYFLNNATQALADINTLRNRVQLPAKAGLTGTDLLYQIWKERRLELAGEFMRLYDLRREIDPINNKPMIDNVMGPTGSFVLYNKTSNDYWETSHPQERQDKGTMFIVGRHELWPIPQDEIDRSNGSLTQNPGY